jgi:drug/metabolite transporter (DMT)-like permease
MMKWGAGGVASAVPASAVALAPLLFLVLRLILGTALLPAVSLRSVRMLNRGTLWMGSVLGLPFAVAFIMQIYGLGGVSPGISAFLTSLFVVFTPVIGWVTGIEKPRRVLAGAVVFSLAGVALLAGPGGESKIVGVVLSVAAAVLWAVQIILTDRFTRRADPDALCLVQTAFAAVVSLVALAVMPGGLGLLDPAIIASVLRVPAATVGIVVTAVFGSVAAQLLMNRYQKLVSPNRAALIYMAEPFFALLFSVVMCSVVSAGFTETLTWTKLGGGLLIFAAIWLLEHGREARKTR